MAEWRGCGCGGGLQIRRDATLRASELATRPLAGKPAGANRPPLQRGGAEPRLQPRTRGAVTRKAAEYLDGLSEDAARAVLARCCSARRWVEQVLAARPFASDAELLESAERFWWALGREDWLEAFAGHPRIGAATTDAGGRVGNLLPQVKDPAGTYRLRFDVGAYFAAQGAGADAAPFYPYVEIVFQIRDVEHYHVPLLVSPFGYTTYRGS